MSESSCAVTDVHTSTRRLVAAGLCCALSGLSGILVGLVTVAYPPAVPAGQWSYPFTTGTQWVVSLVLVLTHLLTAVGFVGIIEADPHRGRRVTTIGLWVAVVGFVALAVAELLSGAIGGEEFDSSAVSAVGTLFGVASLATAVGGVVAGVGILRAGQRRGVVGWAVLASALIMLLLVTPANIGGGLVVRTVALMVWSLPFLPLGRTLARGPSS